MQLKIIERKDVDIQKWDALVAQTGTTAIFSFSFYLDAVAENWCVITNDAYSAGIALPYTVRARRKILYTPIFVSYLEAMGEMDEDLLRSLILKQFKTIEIEFRTPVLGEPQEVFVTQLLNREKKRKGQVNRMLNKAKRANLEVVSTKEWKNVFEIVSAELKGKFSGMTEVSLQRLKEAYEEAAKNNQLNVFEVQQQKECVGGVICIEANGQLFYSKGACAVDARDNGGMYAAIDAAISYANEQDLIFDFGGSRVDGVRRFNHAFGGEDIEYASYRIDRSPRWFRWVRRLKKRWGKKS